MGKKERIVKAMQALRDELNRQHEGSAIAKYVAGTLTNLQHCEGVGFSGTLQDFFQHVPVVKLSEAIELSDAETKLWNQVFSYQELTDSSRVARVKA